MQPSISTRITDRAFTLIELLVVLSIISLLVAILLPTLKEAKEAGRATQCAAGLRQMALAVDLYAEDHNGFAFPTLIQAPYYTYTVAWYSGGADPRRSYYAGPYLRQPRYGVEAVGRAFDCPTTPVGYGGNPIDYAYNQRLGGFGQTAGKHPHLVHLHTMKRPAAVISFNESTGSRYYFDTGSYRWDDPLLASYPHGGRANYPFIDGHVSRLPPGEILLANVRP